MRGRMGMLAVTVVFLAVCPAAVDAASPPAALEDARLKVSPAAAATLERHLSAAPPVARRLARKVAPHLTIRKARVARSRAHGVPLVDGRLRFVIELRPGALRPTARGRFSFLHELGHVVDWAFVDEELRGRFNQAFAASTASRPCFAYRDGCVTDTEIFADQFAFWAGARRSLRSGYGVPPLLSRRAFGELAAAVGWSDGSLFTIRPG